MWEPYPIGTICEVNDMKEGGVCIPHSWLFLEISPSVSNGWRTEYWRVEFSQKGREISPLSKEPNSHKVRDRCELTPAIIHRLNEEVPDYGAFSFNCEHFASYILTGKTSSRHVNLCSGIILGFCISIMLS